MGKHRKLGREREAEEDAEEQVRDRRREGVVDFSKFARGPTLADPSLGGRSGPKTVANMATSAAAADHREPTTTGPPSPSRSGMSMDTRPKCGNGSRRLLSSYAAAP
jgi:hypothetical protein